MGDKIPMKVNESSKLQNNNTDGSSSNWPNRSPPNVLSPIDNKGNSSSSISPSWANMVRLCDGNYGRNLKATFVRKVDRQNKDDLKSIGFGNVRSSHEQDVNWPMLRNKHVRNQRSKDPSFTPRDWPHKVLAGKRKSTNTTYLSIKNSISKSYGTVDIKGV